MEGRPAEVEADAGEAMVVEAGVALLRWRCPGVRTLRGDGGDRVGPGVAMKRKKMGTTNGAPDLTAHIYGPGKGPLQVEFKAAGGGRLRPDQVAWIEAERAEGRHVFVVRSVAEMDRAIDKHLKGEPADPPTQTRPRRRRRSARASLPPNGTTPPLRTARTPCSHLPTRLPPLA